MNLKYAIREDDFIKEPIGDVSNYTFCEGFLRGFSSITDKDAKDIFYSLHGIKRNTISYKNVIRIIITNSFTLMPISDLVPNLITDVILNDFLKIAEEENYLHIIKRNYKANVVFSKKLMYELDKNRKQYPKLYKEYKRIFVKQNL